ncbi:MAG: ATP-grasp domain-containing protein [Desulfobacterales bacterium]|nr:MAG: ATP-grasp domain-containing protein [Desulfobacterales bacterium]
MSCDVFLTDGHWRKTLATVRALGIMGVRVTVGESTRLATAAFSKYCHRRVVYPSPLFKASEFINFVKSEMVRRSYQMLLPMEDETVTLLSKYRSEFSQWTYLPVPSQQKLRFAQNKANVLKLAEKSGIPIPKTWYIHDISMLNDLKDELPYPVVIKPKNSAGAVGVFYPKNSKELMKQYLTLHRRFPYPLIQEQIPSHGAGYGASLLMDEAGRIKASFVHKRLREYPNTGGASTLRVSVRHDEILDMASTLLKTLDWFGVAMVEFKMDPRDRTPKLMEINPRFWGSLFLAVTAGVNFPYLLYRMSRGEKFTPVEHYQIGKKCRWLLPGDILHFIHHPKKGDLLPGFFNFWEKHTAYDILSAKDPLPVLARILTPLTFLYDKDMKHRLKQRVT